jgi:thiosulfate dehydrogenase
MASVLRRNHPPPEDVMRFRAYARSHAVFVVAVSALWLLANSCSSGSVGSVSRSATAPDTAALVRRGRLIFDDTPRYASAYVGNTLSCNDCHLDGGTARYAAPLIDAANLFPRYSKRAGQSISLQRRIQECFTRSEAGTSPPSSSPQIEALVAYIEWLSRHRGHEKAAARPLLVHLPALTGNPTRGKAIYISRCSACHGANGAGLAPIIPPLWGKDSFNTGAGMNNPSKMAAFVVRNMPKGHPGILTPQQAYDVAAYVHSMPHPKLNPAYRKY